MVVTRFAPSPTGYLHIGSARTALFSWLLARHSGGTFILRIEDTDQRRSTAESARKILEDLRWLGLDWDEGPDVGGPNGPYFQSRRLDTYRKYIDQLIQQDRAYKCFETPEELSAARKADKAYRYNGAGRKLTAAQITQYEAEGRPCVVRLRMGDEDITVNDAILGSVTFKAEELEDFVIRKSDGFPTFHLAVVVDDYIMGVTHVIRGQEHLMNTPKHMALQRALGFSTPGYAHIPLIFNMAGTKMSKRDKDKAAKLAAPIPEIDINDFRLAGYLPEAILNFVALLGWSPGGDREFMTPAEMTELFSIERIGKTNARFDRDKLRAFNAEYIKNADKDRLRYLAREFLELTDYPLKHADDVTLDRIIDMYRPRSRTLADMAESSAFFLADRIEYDPKAVRKVLAKEGVSTYLTDMHQHLADLQPWTAAQIHQSIDLYAAGAVVKIGAVAQPIRVAVAGKAVSPPIDQTLELLGREKTLARILTAMQQV